MDKINCTSRFSSINFKIILTQTDTTVGFLSQNDKKLKDIKSREDFKSFIKVFKNFESLKKSSIRIPKTQKVKVRRAKKTTFIVKGISFRVAQDRLNSKVLQSSSWNYSTSANEKGKMFNRDFCEEKADIIIENDCSLYQGVSSSLYKINNKKTERLR